MDPKELNQKMTEGPFMLNLEIRYLRDHPEVFNNFLEKYER